MLVIEAKKISKKFKDNILYQNATLEIEEGATIGIVGVNGSGKSVLFKMLAGLEYADSGDIIVRGKKVGKECDFPSNIGIFVNQPGYIDYYSGFQNLKLLADIQGKISDEKIRLYMMKMGLDPSDKTKVRNYSSGMKQKLGIVQAIMEDQDIIMLDEPFNALDFYANQEVLAMLSELKKEGKTILLTSHQHIFLEKTCDRIYLIKDKKIVLLNDELKNSYFGFSV